MIRRLNMMLATLVLLIVANGALAQVIDITGSYKCEGLNPDGGMYRGTVQITKQGSIYQIKWTIGQGESYNGIGILEGDVLAVSYYGGISGVVAYKIEPGPTLVGKWAIADGGGKAYPEILRR